MIKILLQTTIPALDDAWSVHRYSLLRDYLSSLGDARGEQLFTVTTRDREPDARGHDPVLSGLAESDFDEIWLFAADDGDGLSERDCAGISAFRRRGGGILATRDHQDAGASICSLGGVGAAHYFHTRNQDPDPERRCVDDTQTTTISWPNYHSGRNGDYQKIIPVEPVHNLLYLPGSDGEQIEFFPAHPHEGAVGAPAGQRDARVIAVGSSKLTNRPFNLIVAFEGGEDREGNRPGRALAHSSFHHFADYNWNPDAGCPSFVAEAPGDGMKQNPCALGNIRAYVRNAALWLVEQERGNPQREFNHDTELSYALLQ
jgi:hypothetical protein